MKAILAVTCLALAIHTAYSCSCLKMTKKEKYCRANFTIEAEVLGKKIRIPTGGAFYRIRVDDVVRMENITTVDMTKLYTAENDALCGVFLPYWNSYFLAGDIENGRMSVDLCRSLFINIRPGRVGRVDFDAHDMECI